RADSVDLPRQRREQRMIEPLSRLRVRDDLAAKPGLELVQPAPILTGGAGNTVPVVDLGRRGILWRDAPQVVLATTSPPRPAHGLELNVEPGAMCSVPCRGCAVHVHGF